jgi:threonine/homoserine/homoserine lactone efflux protein
MSDASFQRRRISTLLLTDDLAGFIVAGFALTGSPGPATLSLAGTAAAFGVRKGVPLAAGCIAGVVLVMLVTASGLAGLVLAQPFLGPVVRGLAGAYMLYLAWRIATAPPIGAANRAGRAPSLLAGILLNIGNPKAYAAMAALFSGFTLSTGDKVGDLTVKVVILVAIMVVVDLAWLAAGSALTRIFRDPRKGRILNIAFAVLLLASLAVAFIH